MPHLPIAKTSLRVHWLVPKQPNSSRNRAQHTFPAQRPEPLTSRTDALKNKAYATPTYCKNQFESPLAGCETAEQQQESCPTCLPSSAPRISKVACWRPKKNKAQKLPFPTEQNHARWHQPVCHLVPCALADSSGALPLCDAGVGGYNSSLKTRNSISFWPTFSWFLDLEWMPVLECNYWIISRLGSAVLPAYFLQTLGQWYCWWKKSCTESTELFI